VIGLLRTILAVILVVWLLFDLAGNLIHVLLIVALAILICNLVTGRRVV
jgi:hypothetical protein